MAWKTVSSESSYGPRGEATIQIQKASGKVRVSMKDKKYVVDKDECPETVQGWFETGVQTCALPICNIIF